MRKMTDMKKKTLDAMTAFRRVRVARFMSTPGVYPVSPNVRSDEDLIADIGISPSRSTSAGGNATVAGTSAVPSCLRCLIERNLGRAILATRIYRPRRDIVFQLDMLKI